jgi:hypothetical protein
VIIFSDLRGSHKEQNFEKLEEIGNNSDHISDVVTNTGVEGIDGPVGRILTGEDSAVIFSEFLDREN